MIEYPVADLAHLMREITDTTTELEKEARHSGQNYDSRRYKETMNLIDQIATVAWALEPNPFNETIKQIQAHHRRAGNKATIATLAADARHVRDGLLVAVKAPLFFFVEPALAEFFDRSELFGDAVYNAFPSARSDIHAAGNCLTADCNTAAVFHLMRSVEWGMRALCAHLGFRQLKVHKKGGRIKYRPIEYAVWESVLDALQGKVDEKTKKLPQGPRKQKLQEFYYSALSEIRAIRDAWRNHVMHTRAEYSAKQAAAILEHVKRLMQNLATRISES